MGGARRGPARRAPTSRDRAVRDRPRPFIGPGAQHGASGGAGGRALEHDRVRCSTRSSACAVRLRSQPGERVPVAFVTGGGRNRASGPGAGRRSTATSRASERAFELAWSQAQLEPRHLRVSADDLQRYQQLASHMLFPSDRLRASERQLRQNHLGQSRLWAYGISGDLPILLVTIGDARDLDLVREALMAHTYWRLRGFKADLVILNEEAAGYEQPLREELRKLIQSHAQYTGIDQPGGIFLRAAGQHPAEDLALLCAVARVVLVASRGPLAAAADPPAPPRAPSCRRPLAVRPALRGGAVGAPAVHGAALLQRPGRLHAGRPGVRHLPRALRPDAGARGSTSWPTRSSAR